MLIFIYLYLLLLLYPQKKCRGENQEGAASIMVLTPEHILCTDGKDDAAWYASFLKRLVDIDQALFCATFDGSRMEWRRRNAEKDGRRRRGG
jgi:hypothetical protein